MNSKNLIAALVLCMMVFGPIRIAASDQFKLDTKLALQGKIIFDRQCVACHGHLGKGNGEAAYLLFPRPRDLTSKIFK